MAKKAKKPRKKRSVWRGLIAFLVFVLVVAALLGIGIGAGFVAAAVRSLPPLSSFEPQPNVTSMIYDGEGNLIARLHALENRIPVSLDVMPENLQNAFIAMEDERFFQHKGVNPIAILRAFYVNLSGGSIQGGSTITQQLVRTALLKSTARTYTRKIQEAILSIQIERRFTKREILEMYMNQIPLGHGAYGVETASQVYFGKPVSTLTLAECALLVGITPAPSGYSPYSNYDLALQRRAIVLNKMVEQGYITEVEAQAAKEEPINLAGLREEEEWAVAPHFLDYVLRQLLDRYGPDLVYNGGLKVYTTLDVRAQEAARNAISQVLDETFPLEGTDKPMRAGIAVLDPSNGHIKALVARTYEGRLGHIDAVDALRQPGSAFKPIAAYAPALEMGFTAGTVLDDAPMFNSAGKVWPENYDRRFRGLMTVRRGIELSINVLAVKTLDAVGVERGVEYCQRLGITSLATEWGAERSDYTRSLALGGLTKGVSPLEMAAAFGTFGNSGIHVKPVSILKVVDQFDNVLEEAEVERTAALKEETAYIMTDILKGVITRGTGTQANIGRVAAGKTGTSSDHADAWFVGYTPYLSAAVWMGFEERQPMDRVVGGQYPAAMWAATMKPLHEGLPNEDFKAPDGLVRVNICTKSGLRPGDWCPEEHVTSELFIRGTEPLITCDVHVPALVCAENPTHLATPWCPQQVTVSFIRRKEPYTPTPDGRYPMDAEQELPTEYCDVHDHGLIQPPPGYDDDDERDSARRRDKRDKDEDHGIIY